MKRLRLAGALFCLAALVGCSVLYEGKYDWDEGWRVGQVVHVGTGTAVPSIARADCRNGVDEEIIARTTYADVRFQTEGRWYRHRIVPVPSGLALAEGQRVYINVNACIAALAPASAFR